MKARVIAYYLPQYHPIPENDEWWGKGFTEWVNVAKAKPLFRGHYQPKVPSELGFYDLRMPEVREEQARLAKEAGIEGFMYWHYWFGNGKQLLERPFNEVLSTRKPDFPFCLGWANHTWSSKTWNKEKHQNTPLILMEQKYLGIKDYTEHFYSVLPAFKDGRYITVDGKPFFLIFDPRGFKDISNLIACWRKLAIENGLKGIHFVGLTTSVTFRSKESKSRFSMTSADENYNLILNMGFDAVNSIGQGKANFLANGKYQMYISEFLKRIIGLGLITKIDQSKVNKFLFSDEDRWDNVYPTIIPNFDRTPRTNKDTVYVNSTPKAFETLIRRALEIVKNKKDEHKIIMLKSWNEWGEGNYVEPDIKYGRGYLDALHKTLVEE